MGLLANNKQQQQQATNQTADSTETNNEHRRMSFQKFDRSEYILRKNEPCVMETLGCW